MTEQVLLIGLGVLVAVVATFLLGFFIGYQAGYRFGYDRSKITADHLRERMNEVRRLM